MTATDQEIADLLGEIGQNLKRLIAAEVANAVFQMTGEIPTKKAHASAPISNEGHVRSIRHTGISELVNAGAVPRVLGTRR
jgi:hypothetical protein